MPADVDKAKLVAALDPYVLRAKALDEALTLHEIGRALFPLNQRRGFKSNRKAARKANAILEPAPQALEEQPDQLALF